MIAVIPTSSRAEMCLSVAKNLSKFEKVLVLVNNCEITPYYILQWPDNVVIFNWTHIKGEPKKCHNTVIKKYLSNPTIKDTLFIEDDVTFSDKFDRFFDIFSNLKAIYGAFSFSPIYIPEKKCRYTTAEEKHLTNNLFTQVYIDGNFSIPVKVLKEFRELANTESFPVLKSNSGISPVLSKYMAAKKYPMICHDPSLLGHGDHDSIQFPEGRKKVPLIAKI